MGPVTITVDPLVLKRSLRNVLLCVSTDAVRPALCTVHAEWDGTDFHLVASNSYILCHVKVPIESGTGETGEWNIPNRLARLIAMGLPLRGKFLPAGRLTLDSSIRLDWDELTLEAPTQDVIFPNWRPLLNSKKFSLTEPFVNLSPEWLGRLTRLVDPKTGKGLPLEWEVRHTLAAQVVKMGETTTALIMGIRIQR